MKTNSDEDACLFHFNFHFQVEIHKIIGIYM